MVLLQNISYYVHIVSMDGRHDIRMQLMLSKRVTDLRCISANVFRLRYRLYMLSTDDV